MINGLNGRVHEQLYNRFEVCTCFSIYLEYSVNSLSGESMLEAKLEKFFASELDSKHYNFDLGKTVSKIPEMSRYMQLIHTRPCTDLN